MQQQISFETSRGTAAAVTGCVGRLLGHVMALPVFVQPHTHRPIRAGVFEDLVRPLPAGLRPFGLAVTANEEASDREADEYDHDHDPDPALHAADPPPTEGEPNRTAVP